MNNILYETDFYKVDHRRQYPEGTETVYSVLTPRSLKNYPAFEGRVETLRVCDLKAIVDNMLGRWEKEFFSKGGCVVDEYKTFIESSLGIKDFNISHLKDLHQYQKMPLEFDFFAEGTEVHINTPILTVYNTVPQFFWLTNYIETYLLSEVWKPLTIYNIAHDYKSLCEYWANKTCDSLDHVPYQCHDFSYRGVVNRDDALAVGLNHLKFFEGTDNVLAAKTMYDRGLSQLRSIPATEHSVMCAGGRENEDDTYRRLVVETYPEGLLSIVSDTWDYFRVLTEVIPSLKSEILRRKGKLVIRPDSGDPVKIVCGDPRGKTEVEQLGTVRFLDKQFGSTINSKGYKVLCDKVGVIYGDSISPSTANEIMGRLSSMGFASSAVVFGLGAFSYVYLSRDTLSIAFKSTWARIKGKGLNLKKDPKTDQGKKSSTGRFNLMVVRGIGKAQQSGV